MHSADATNGRTMPMQNVGPWVLNTLIAAIVAGLLSGIPSTGWALATGGDPWEATLAAGAIVLGPAASFASCLPRRLSSTGSCHCFGPGSSAPVYGRGEQSFWESCLGR